MKLVAIVVIELCDTARFCLRRMICPVPADRVPRHFREGILPADILQDSVYDTDAYLTRTHRGEQLVKFVRQRDVRELVHTEMDVNGKPAAVDDIRLVIKLLEHLRIEHSHEEIEGTVVVRDNSEDCRFLFSQAPQLHFVVLGYARKAFQIELFQT